MAFFRHHGGSLDIARRLFPGAPEPFLDLSTGIAPIPYPLPEPPPDRLRRLPEAHEERDLREAAAKAYGIRDLDHVVAAPGSQILISLLPRLFPAREVAILGPTYGEHAASWRAAGVAVREETEVDAWVDAAGAPGRAMVVCNPNNPDGRRLPPSVLAGVATRCAAAGGLLVVDEAFADLEPEPLSVAPLVPLPGLVVLRSFGKSYGLAGVRLGFLLAEASLAASVSGALGPWAVSGPALWAGRQALSDHEWREAAAGRLASDADRLDGLLTAAGLRVLGGTRLFRLVRAEGAEAIFLRLARAGILVRPFGGDRSDLLRFGIPGDPETWRRLRTGLGRPAA
ncbi:threonine-phosphate decarboxylase CobD [Rhizosaccharibacter radicis]|uniref:threonine-phosphate decarboxylase n=1 Tax=Rhizosaccharibacter radicis TaxID=2782605 RepID=A0ABT1VY82_9PROT|nr:threonine-phosphate decarboxylase CobD [Acetobacteraceae bacterium KSS12]